MALTGCAHSITGGDAADAAPAATPAAWAPNVKIADKFFHDVNAGDTTAAVNDTCGINGDPIGLLYQSIKAHGHIAHVAYTRLQPYPDNSQAWLYGALTFADRSTFNFCAGETATNGSTSTINWSIFMVSDADSGLQAPKAFSNIDYGTSNRIVHTVPTP